MTEPDAVARQAWARRSSRRGRWSQQCGGHWRPAILPSGGQHALLASALAVTLLLVGCAAQEAPSSVARLPEPLAIYGRLPTIEHVELSPDGSRVAFVKTFADGQRVVAVALLEGNHLVASLRVGDTKLRDIKWLDADALLLTTSATAAPRGLVGMPSEWVMLQVFDVAKRELRPLLGSEADTMNVAFGRAMVRRLDGRTVLFVGGYFVTNRVLPGLFRIDVGTGRELLIHKGRSTSRGFLVDEAGEVVAEEHYHDADQRWAFAIRSGGALREVATGEDPFDSAGILGLDSTGQRLVVSVPESDGEVWRTLSLTDGTWGVEPGESHDEVVLDRDTDRVIGWFELEDAPRYGFADPALQARWDNVVRYFRDERVELASMSDDRSRIVALVEGPRHGYAYELIDLNRNSITDIGAVYEGISRIAEVRRITYPAADGLEIPAYLTLPPDRAARGLPLVVMPHGGPATRDVGTFDWWAQALASQGYAVLQPNFRGSTVSQKMLAAGFGEWGRKMQTDLSDGVRFLAKDGIIDPTRVCIVGASYGGYAALAGVTLDRDVYRCAVSAAGISDLRRYLTWVKKRDRRRESSQRWWNRFMGVESPDDPVLDAISPIEHVAAVSAPILLIHGRDDTVVPFEQTQVMKDALEDAGKQVQAVTLDGEDHWLSRGATRLQLLEHVVGFLVAHNPSR